MKTRDFSSMMVLAILILSLLVLSPSVRAEKPREVEDLGGKWQLHREILRRAGLGCLPRDPRETMQRQDFARVVVDLVDMGELREIMGGACPDIEDRDEISADRRSDVAALRAMEVIAGGEFRPADPITRVEVVSMLLRALGEDPEEDAEFPLGPVIKAADVGMVDEWPGPAEEVADGEFICAVLAWVYRELNPPVAGVVADAGNGSLTISAEDGEAVEYGVASDIYVAGADSVEATRFQMVLGFEDPGGDIGVIETAEEVETTVGEISAHRIEDRLVRTETDWVDISGLFLEVNGMPLGTNSKEYLENEADRWVEEGLQVAVHRSEEGKGFVSILEYDLDPVAVLCVDDEDDQVILGYSGQYGYVEEKVDFERLTDVPVGGAVDHSGRLKEGDVLRIASFGGFGMIGDPPPERIDVHRSSVDIRPIIGDHRKRRDEKGLRYIFEVDGDDYHLDPARFLGSVDELLEAVWARVSVDRSRNLVQATEILAFEDIGVGLFEEVQTVDGNDRVILDLRGIDFVLPVDPGAVDVIAELGEIDGVLDRFLSPTLNSDGMLTGFDDIEVSSPDLDDDGSPDEEVEVIGILPEHDCCVVETDGASSANSYHLLVDPWVVSGVSGSLDVEEITPGSVSRLREISGTRVLLLD
ncbi:MAG: hypothetical protein ACOCVQ_00960 [Bacillota bacterium]